MSTLEEIRALYEELPSVECKGLCWNSCGPIDMSDAERERITELGVEIPVFTQERSQAWADGAKLYCPALSFAARGGGPGCSVYQDRPLICRAWGVGEGDLACPHGCKTTGRISHTEVSVLIARSFQIGGHGDDDVDDGAEILAKLMADPEYAELTKRLMQGDRSVVPAIQAQVLKLREASAQ